MTDMMTSQNIDISSWDTLYGFPKTDKRSPSGPQSAQVRPPLTALQNNLGGLMVPPHLGNSSHNIKNLNKSILDTDNLWRILRAAFQLQQSAEWTATG
jgi:hypothetical protein